MVLPIGDLLEILYRWQWLPILVAFFFIYVSYYYIYVVQKPQLVCKQGPFRDFVEKNCVLLKEPYRPTIWCFNSHLQTVIRALLRSRPAVPFRRETLETPDGGIVCLDWFDNNDSIQYNDPETRPTVLILPGLTGGSETSYCRHLVLQGKRLGYRTIVSNHRGFGASQLKTPRTFCAANTEDLQFVLSHIHNIHPHCRMFAVGISMGGMILMNYLNEMGEDETHLVGGMAASAPWNCTESTESLEQPVNSFIFNRHLTKNLVNMVKGNIEVFEQHLSKLPYSIDHVLKSRTVREFDERFTSPTFGYRSYEEYYSAATLHTKPLHEIRVPLLCLNAADDPFSPLHAIPVDAVMKNPLIALVITAYGGHIGFVEGLTIHETNFFDRLFLQFVQPLFELTEERKQKDLFEEKGLLSEKEQD